MCAHEHKSRHPTPNTVFLKAGLIPPGITLLRDQWQANSFTALQKTKPMKGQPGKDSEEPETQNEKENT